MPRAWQQLTWTAFSQNMKSNESGVEAKDGTVLPFELLFSIKLWGGYQHLASSNFNKQNYTGHSNWWMKVNGSNPVASYA